MITRIVLALLLMGLTPALATAQRFGGVRHGGIRIGMGGHGFRHGFHPGFRHGFVGGFGGFGRVAPFTGFGQINHPGLGFAPNTPGIGFPLGPGIVTQPFIGPIRPGATGFGPPFGFGGHFLRHHGLGFFGWGGVAVVGAPWAAPVVMGGYPSTPSVIIIQQPTEPGPALQEPPQPRELDREKDVSLTYETRRPLSEEKPTAPLTLLVLKDHSIYAVTRYRKEGDRLCYVTSYGARNCIRLDLLDLEFTRKLNEERHIQFEP